MTLNSRILKTAFAICSAILASATATFAQDVAQMGTADLKNEASSLVAERRYVDARPYVLELIKRISESTDESLRKELEQLYYFEAFGYLQEYVNAGTPNDELLKKSIDGFTKVIVDYPAGEFVIDSIKKKASVYDQLKDMENSVKTLEMLLVRPYVEKLNRSEQLGIVRDIAARLYMAQKWSIADPWFKRLLEMSPAIDDKVFSGVGLIQSCLVKKDYEGAKKYFPLLAYNSPARSDIAFNIGLLTACDTLVKQQKYSDAILFLSMVLDRDAIIANLKFFIDREGKRLAYTKRMNPNSPAALELEGKIKNFEAQLKVVEGISSYAADITARIAQCYMLTERNYESFWAYWQMIESYSDHPNIEDFYYATMAAAYRIGKFDEMFALGEAYLKKFPDGTYVRDVRLNKAQYYLAKKDYAAFFADAKKFIDDYAEESQAKDVIYLMGKTWLDLNQQDELIKTFEAYSQKHTDTVISEPCLYWSGLAYMGKGDFQKASKTFKKMIEEFPTGDYSEDGAYRAGVAAFGAADFTAARDILEEFVKTHDKSQLRGEAEFFLGDIYANVNEVDIAMSHYKKVEEYTKNQSFIDNSYNQGAKLLHNLDRFEEEIALMDRYVEKFPNGICSEALFNKAKALELLGMPAEALKIYTDTIVKYGKNPKDDGVDKIILDYNRMYTVNEPKLKATVEFLKKIMTDKELLTQMVEIPAKRYRYFQDNPLIDKRLYEKFKRDKSYGANLYTNKSNIKKQLDQYAVQISNYPQGGTGKVFNQILNDANSAKNYTLAYRIMMGLDSIGKPAKVNKMFNDDDIKLSSVRTLVWIGRVNEKYGAEYGRKAFAEALSRNEFEYEIDAMFGLAELEERQSAWDSAMKLYSQIEDEFPSDARAANAVLRRAEILAKLGKRPESIKCYEQILKSPSWRGDAHAEALYRLGLISQNENKLDEALMFYDRCYLGFAGCYAWTGKAVIAAVKLLSARGENKTAQGICNEFIENKLNEASPEYKEIQQLLLTL